MKENYLDIVVCDTKRTIKVPYDFTDTVLDLENEVRKILGNRPYSFYVDDMMISDKSKDIEYYKVTGDIIISFYVS